MEFVEGVNLAELVQQRGLLPSVRVLRQDVPDAVAEVIDKMIAARPDDRFATPKEVAEALAPFVEDCNLGEFVASARRTTTSCLDLSRVSSASRVRLSGVSARPAEKTPTISFSISEQELNSLSAKDLVGDYAAWSYFETIERPQNQAFVARFQARYGKQRAISDPMEAAYFGVHLWAQAVQEAGSADVPAVRRAIGRQSYDAPEGVVRVDPETQHTFRVFHIGRITTSRFAEVFSSET